MSYVSRAKQIGRGVVFVGAVTAFSLTTLPIAAQADDQHHHHHHQGVGAAIGLGILGGAIAGAAIAVGRPAGARTHAGARAHVLLSAGPGG